MHAQLDAELRQEELDFISTARKCMLGCGSHNLFECLYIVPMLFIEVIHSLCS